MNLLQVQSAVVWRWLAVFSGLLLTLSLALGAGVQDDVMGDESRGVDRESTLGAGNASPSSPQGTMFVPAHRQANNVAVLPVRGEIDGLTLRSLERRIQRAVDEGFGAVVIEIDTPGGYLDAARDIVHLLKNDAPVNTVAWVNTDAFSAGTLIALACREIVVHPMATWGDCAPIQVAVGQLVLMPPAERAKAEAPLRADVVDSAQRYGYDERLVEGFISVNIELWMLENTITNERIFVNRAEYRQLFGTEPPDQIAPGDPSSLTAPSPIQPSPIRPLFDRSQSSPGMGDDEPMTPEEYEQKMQQWRDEALTLPSQRPPIESLNANDWTLVRQVLSSNQLLTVRAAESIDYGLATAVIRTDQELCAYFGTTNLDPAIDLVRWEESWSEQLVRFLVNGWVRAMLGVVFIIGLFLELAAPGVGIFGAVAAGALLVLIGAPYLAGMAEWWEVLLIVAGLALMATEIFVLPGFGVAGIAGVVCLLVGIVGSFVSGDLGTSRGQEQLVYGIGWTLLATLGGAVGLWILTRYVYDFPLFNRLILSATTDSASSTAEAEGRAVQHTTDSTPSVAEPGDVGTAETDLRPAGRAMIHGRAVDVVSVGEWIEAGSSVRVTSVGRFRVEVERAD